MTALAFLAFGAICGLVGFAFGCDYMRRAVDTEARRRALLERALDKALRGSRERPEDREAFERAERLRAAKRASNTAKLMKWMEAHDPWWELAREIEDMPEQRDANLRRGEQ